MANEVTIVVKTEDRTKSGFDSVAGGLKGVLGAIAGVGVALTGVMVGVGFEATKMAVNFQSNMERLVTQAGVSQAKLAQLKSGVLDLAAQVGFSPDSLAESLYHVASNMQSMGATSQQMMDVVKTAAEGAKVGGADLVDVTNALTAAVASGIPGVQSYSKAMGTLNAIVGTGDMKMQDLADAFGTGMVAVVKGFGLSLTDVGAALATFGDNNIRGAQAGTNLRMSVQALAAPMSAGKKILDQWGMSSNQLAKDMQTGGLLKALTDLKSHMDAAGISAQQQGEVITEIFGKKAGTGINILIGQLDRVKSKYAELDKGASGFGDAWTKTQQTVKQQLDDLKAGFDALMIRIGDKLLPIVNKIVSWAVQELPKVEKALSSIATKVSPYLEELGNLIKKVFQPGPIMNNLDQIKKDAQQVVEQIKQHWPEIKEIIGLVAAVIYGLVIAILKVIDVVLKIDAVMIQVWSKVIDIVNRAAMDIVGAFIAILGPIARVASALHLPFAAGLNAALDDAKKFRSNFQAEIDSLHGKTVTVTTVNVVKNVTIGSSSYTQLSTGRAANFAHGGIVGAASGTVRSGLTMVGEHGAELVDLPAGAHVYSNPDTGRMLSGGGGTTKVSTTVDFVGNVDQMFATWFMRAQRQGLIQIRSTSIVS